MWARCHTRRVATLWLERHRAKCDRCDRAWLTNSADYCGYGSQIANQIERLKRKPGADRDVRGRLNTPVSFRSRGPA